jgi:DNA-binding NarL/FixJ family response regulator
VSIRVLLVDDQALFRAGIGMIIGTQPDLVLVGECATGEEAVRFVRERPDVDVVLMDVLMPGLGGIAATTTIAHGPGAPKVLVLTTFDDDDTVAAALAAGASGFVMKDARAELLTSSIRSVADGTAVVARSASLHRLAQRAALPVPAPPEFLTLTESERRVFRHAAAGMSNREIAATTFLSEATVKSYVSRILGKLALRDRAQLVLFAVRHGLDG